MLNIAYTHASVVLVIFYYMPQNNQSNRYSLYTVTSDVGVICISNKVEYIDKEESYIILPKKLYNNFN